MHVHEVGSRVQMEAIEKLKRAHVKAVPVRGFEDPHREYLHTMELSGTIRQWLTMTVDERKKQVLAYAHIPQRDNESKEEYEVRMLKRRRDLLVIIQEEARAKPEVQSPEVAIGALKQLFPEYAFTPKPK